MAGEESGGLAAPHDTSTSCPACSAREAEEAARDAADDALNAEAARLALDRTMAMNLPLSIELRPEIYHLGSATAKIYAREVNVLRGIFSSNLSKMVACAQAAYWHAGWVGASAIELLITQGVAPDNERTRQLTTAVGYLADQGAASTMFAVPNSITQTLLARLARVMDLPWLEDFLADNGYPGMSCLVLGQACHYFHKADALAEQGGSIAKVMNLVCEAHEMRMESWADVAWARAMEEAHESAEVQRNIRRAQARAGAVERLNRDPRQREKVLVHQCWLAWQEDPSRYRSQAAFARDMLTKCAHLVNSRTIEDWCREWGKAASSS